MADQQALATFLRARRDLLKPAALPKVNADGWWVCATRKSHCWPASAPSTTCGSSRAGKRQPSDQVLDGLAGALQLNDDAAQYMHTLAHPPRRRRRAAAAAEKVDPGLQTLVDTWNLTPAYVQDRHMNILLSNALAGALMPYFAPGANHLRFVFLEPELRGFVTGMRSPASWCPGCASTSQKKVRAILNCKS